MKDFSFFLLICIFEIPLIELNGGADGTARKSNICTGQQPLFSTRRLTGIAWSVLNGMPISTGQNAGTKVTI